jgi:hypothetical protein
MFSKSLSFYDKFCQILITVDKEYHLKESISGEKDNANKIKLCDLPFYLIIDK